MKKLICLILALAVCTVLFAGCGKFDMDNEDLTAYVKLGDITEFTYEEVCRQYEEYREQLAESTTSFSPASGYTLDFLVKAELVGEDDSLTEIEKWTHNSDDDYVKEYDVYRNGDYSAFDYALCYKVSDASDSTTTARSVEIGKEFSFTMELDEDYEDETLAGKTVKFTINVKKALPAVYADTYISDMLLAFYNAVSGSKEIIEYGDTVKMDFTGTIDGEKFDGGTGEDFSIVVGEGELIKEFEDQLVGHKNREEFEITVTYPEDYEDEDLAGKEAVFTIKIQDVYNDNDLIEDNTPFHSLWELKYAFRVEVYAPFGVADIVYDRSELIAYPEKLLSEFEKIYTNYVNQEIAANIQLYAQYGTVYTKQEMREMLYPDGSDKTYIEESAKRSAYRYIVVKLVQKELGLEYTEEDYQNDLQKMADEYTAYYGEEYTAKDIEKLFGEQIMRYSFIETLVSETLVERISDMPEIPQKTSSDS